MSFNTDQGSRNAFISIINDLDLLRTPGFNFWVFVHDRVINLDVSLCIIVFESYSDNFFDIKYYFQNLYCQPLTSHSHTKRLELLKW